MAIRERAVRVSLHALRTITSPVSLGVGKESGFGFCRSRRPPNRRASGQVQVLKRCRRLHSAFGMRLVGVLAARRPGKAAIGRHARTAVRSEAEGTSGGVPTTRAEGARRVAGDQPSTTRPS